MTASWKPIVGSISFKPDVIASVKVDGRRLLAVTSGEPMGVIEIDEETGDADLALSEGEERE